MCSGVAGLQRLGVVARFSGRTPVVFVLCKRNVGSLRPGFCFGMRSANPKNLRRSNVRGDGSLALTGVFVKKRLYRSRLKHGIIKA